MDREERELRDTSSGLSQLTEHVSEMRVHLRGSQSSLCTTSSQPTYNLHASPLLFSAPQQHGLYTVLNFTHQNDICEFIRFQIQ